MNKQFILFLLVPMLLISAGCTVPNLPDIFNSGQTVSPVNTTVTIDGVEGTTKTVVINRMQYVVGFEKTSYGVKYMIYPPSYPLGYEGQLTTGNSATVVVSADKIYSMCNARPEIWNSGGKWRAGDTFTISFTGSSANVKWAQTGNTDPTATITMEPTNPIPGQPIRLNADVTTGGDSDELFTQWYLDGKDMEGWIYNIPSQSPFIRTLVDLPSGSHTIELLVWDVGKNEKRVTKTVNIQMATREPTALFTISPSSPLPNTDIYLYSTSMPNTDPNLNQNITHEWYFDGVFLGQGNDYAMLVKKDRGLATLGTHTVRLKVTNSEGLSSEITKSFTISEPTTPVVTPIEPTGCVPSCETGFNCMNGQCVPMPEATPPPAGTFTITTYNGQIGAKNGYEFRYNTYVLGRDSPSYQYVTLEIQDMSLSYGGVYTIHTWYDNFTIGLNPLSPDYNELKNTSLYPMTDLLSDWKNVSNFGTLTDAGTIDSGPGWSKSAKFMITALTEQYATIQITETVSTFTYCGDGICQENCATCPADCGICTDEQKKLYNTAPNAKFDYTVNGKQIIVNSRSTDSDGTIKAFMWVFGDGHYRENGNVIETYTYADYGTFTITLFVTDNLDAVSKTTATVNVFPATAYEDLDTDGDGIKNSNDNCVLQAGPLSNSGCPVVTSITTTSTPSAYCGDGTCNSNETCATCSADCGSCSTTQPATTPTITGTITGTATGTTGGSLTPTVSGVSVSSTTVINPQGSGISLPTITTTNDKGLLYYAELIKSFLLKDFFGLPYWAFGVGILVVLYLTGGKGKKKKTPIWRRK